MESFPVTAHNGERLAAYKGSPRNISASLERSADRATVSFQVGFGNSRNFVRGAYKIALSILAYFLGAELARRPLFDCIRAYVVEDSGNHHLLLRTTNDAEYRISAWAPYLGTANDYAVPFRIAQIEFLVDLTSDERVLRNIERHLIKTQGPNGWCVMPLDT